MHDPLTRASSLPGTATGTNRDAFGGTEWGLLVGIALIWGSSFLFIDVGLQSFRPGVVTLVRVALGTATIALFSKSRQPVDRQHMPRIILLGVTWIAIPVMIFPIAQQWIDSSVAGMLNAAVPILAAAWATILLRRLPGWRQMTGIAVGFVGVVAISLPELVNSAASALGVIFVIIGVAFYGLSTNLAVPLQQRYGALPILFRAQLTALVLVLPYGLLHLSGSTWSWNSALAMVPLGVLSTGAAFAMMTILVGRVGATRGSIAIYFTPIVAIVLGVIVLDETVEPIALVGAAIVLLGAWIASRKEV